MAPEFKRKNSAAIVSVGSILNQKRGNIASASKSEDSVLVLPTKNESKQQAGENKYGYQYSGTDALGKPLKRRVTTPNLNQARAELETAGIKVDQIKPIYKFSLSDLLGVEPTSKPSNMELAEFAELFGDQFEMGEVPTMICEDLARTHPNKAFARALKRVASRLREGSPLYEAFAVDVDEKGRYTFPVTFVHQLKIGEQTGGVMQKMMDRFAADVKSADDLWSAIKGALAYPFGLSVATMIAIALIMIFVVQPTKMIYQSLLPENSDLPLPTQILIDTSDFMVSWKGILTLFVAIIIGVFVRRWYQTDDGQKAVMRWSIRLPYPFNVFSVLLKEQISAALLRNLAILASGGTDMVTRLREAKNTTVHPDYHEMLEHILYQLTEHKKSFSDIFPPYEDLMFPGFRNVLSTFEKDGDMEKQFYRYAEKLEKNARRKVAVVVHVFQNYSIIPIGILIGGIVIALYLPMFILIGRLSGGK